MKKYSYIPRKVESRPILVGGKKLIVGKEILERVSIPKGGSVENSLKPFSVKNLKNITINGGNAGAAPPPPPQGVIWSNATDTWETVTEVWNNYTV